jgi:hypothetical protein
MILSSTISFDAIVLELLTALLNESEAVLEGLEVHKSRYNYLMMLHKTSLCSPHPQT